MIDYFLLFLLSLLGGMVGLVGGFAFLSIKSWSRWLSIYSIPFAAGILLTVALIGLLREAVDLSGENAFLVTVLAFLGAFLFEQFFVHIHHHETCEHCPVKKSSISLIIFGDTIHNAIDGVAIGAAFVVSPGLGLITATSSFLHEVPHEIGDFGILLKTGWKAKKIIAINVISSLATVLGAFAVVLLSPSDTVIGTLLAVSAGIFLFLGASDFVPHIGKKNEGKLESILMLLVGVIIMILTIYAVPHSHEENEGQSLQKQELTIR